MRATVALRDAEVEIEQRRRLRSHRRAAADVDVELVACDALLLAARFDELLSDGRGLARRDLSADDVAAEDVEDDVESEIRPLRRAW